MEFGTDVQKNYFSDEEKMIKVLTLCMGIGGRKRRKDFTTASQAMEFIKFFFERLASHEEYRVDEATRRNILQGFLDKFESADDATVWFGKVKEIAAENGFAAEMKDYKASPEAYRGSVADVAEVLRIATTGKANTPDLWTIQQILGEEETKARIGAAM